MGNITQAKILLGIEDNLQDELLTTIATLTTANFLAYAGVDDVPEGLEYIITEVIIKRFNTRSYAGMVGYIRFPYGSDTSTPVQREGWIKDSVGWYFKNQDGTYPFNAWKNIDGNWFSFNSDGYALENIWFKDDEGFWY